ncbi:hypothetical protein [Nonomuraea sp. NPDC050202]|uniref:hypothetical protein n=1 Tax=Nonomuraea sp. NPDC050202 TaxID=3155035 RepID=UPI00340095EC
MIARQTRAAAVKQALLARLAEALAGLPATAQVQASYAFPGDVERESVYLGSSRFARQRLGPGFDEETLTVNVHVYVRHPGGAVEETDARAAEIGGVLEGALAADRELRGVDGVMFSSVESGELDGGFEDDAAVSLLDYALTFRAAVR